MKMLNISHFTKYLLLWLIPLCGYTWINAGKLCDPSLTYALPEHFTKINHNKVLHNIHNTLLVLFSPLEKKHL